MNIPMYFAGAICDGIECIPLYLVGFGLPFLAGVVAIWVIFIVAWRVVKKSAPKRAVYIYSFVAIMLISAAIVAAFLVIPEKINESNSLNRSKEAVNFEVYELSGTHHTRGFFSSSDGLSSDEVEITLIYDEGDISYMKQRQVTFELVRKYDDQCLVYQFHSSNSEVDCEPKTIDGIQVYSNKKEEYGITGYYFVKDKTALALMGKKLSDEELRSTLQSLRTVPVDQLNISLN